MNNVLKCFLPILAIILLLPSCTTSKTTVSTTVDLSKYEYASVINNDTYHIPAELMEYEIQLFDAVASSRLKLVNDMRIHELTPRQKEELLLVKYGVSNDNLETIVIVNFIDYMTGRPVASCRGAFGLGIDQGSDLKGAIKRVAKQIADTFPPKK
ncbi:MAG: hypothetical protein K2J29_07465 [Muribaculaceae bacterium]|nr:hypothetical protein [Muribaculaceae bacterium]